MALPTGTITMSNVNTEVGRASTATTSLNDSIVRETAASVSGTGVLSGTIGMNNLLGARGTQVINGYTGGTFAPPNPGGRMWGFKTSPSGTPVTNTFGAIPATSESLLGNGPPIAKILNFYYYNQFNRIFLAAQGTANYTGQLRVFYSTSTSSWPALGDGTAMTFIGIDFYGNSLWDALVSQTTSGYNSTMLNIVGIRVQKV
jgi:hypothetical protein